MIKDLYRGQMVKFFTRIKKEILRKKINFNKNQKASKKEVEQFIENVKKKKYTPQDVRQQNIVTKLIDRLYQSSKKQNIIKYD